MYTLHALFKDTKNNWTCEECKFLTIFKLLLFVEVMALPDFFDETKIKIT